jgi:GNAT superfamily N-acetyltransferase
VVEALLGQRYGDETFAVLVDGDVVAFASAHFETQRKNRWTPYVNGVTAYTAPEHRRRGYAKALGLFLEREGRARGCVRFRSMCGSHLGAMLHMSLGHDFWGLTTGRMLAVDSPLVHAVWPEATPISVRRTTDRLQPLSRAELLSVLGNTSLRYDPVRL